MPGTIDQLNFEVLIKDDKFNEKVKADLALAKQLNVELTALLDMQSKVGKFKMPTGSTAKSAAELARAKKAATDAAAAEERLAAAKSNRAAAEARAVKAATQAIAAQNKLTASIVGTTTAASRQGRIFNELKNMALSYLSIRGASQFIQSMVRITGEFELQKVALGSMIGDLNQAKILIADIQQLALKSPFAFKELTSYAKQLAAFSVPANELLETTKMLADVSAGLGVGMDRIVLAYGQIRSAAFLRGQEVRQLTEAGIPILQELAKQFSEIEGRAVSAGEVFDKISARLVPFEMVSKVFKDMTSEGGKFYEMQEIQAETLRGKVMNLKDAFEMMMNEIGTANDDRLKGAVDRLRELMLNWEKIGTILKTIIITFGAYKAALAAAAVYEKALAAVQTYQRWQRLVSVIRVTTGHTVKLGAAMKVLGVTTKMAIGIGIAAVAGLATIIVSAVNKANRLNRELDKIGDGAEQNTDKVANDLSRLVKSLEEATQGTQEYRDIISEINRKYGEYLPNILSERDGYNDVAIAANEAAKAIRNKAKAEAEAEGRAAIEKEYGKGLRDATEDFYSSIVLAGAGGISRKMANSIKEAFDVALLEEGAEDNIYETFRKVADSFLGGEGKFLELYNNLLKTNADAAQLLSERIVDYGEQRVKVNARMEELQKDLDDRFGNIYKTREEALGVEKIEAEYRTLVDELKKVKQSQEAYDEQLKQLDITKLEKLAKLYEDLNRPEVAKGYREQAKALRDLQEGWRGVVNEALKGAGLDKNSSFGLWADEYTQSTKYVEEMLKRYQEINKEMQMIESFDTDMAKNLEQNKKAIEVVAKTLGIDIQALIASKKEGWDGPEKSPEQIELEKQINMVKKLKQSYEELRDFLDDGQMRKILKALFPNAQEAWLKNFDFDAVLKKMADELEKYDTKAASSLRDSVGKGSAKDLADLFEAFKKYKDAVDEWKREDFNFYGGGDVGKILRDLSDDYESIEKKRRKTLELLRKAEAGDAKSIALLRETLGEEVWKKYVTEGKKAIENLANAERTVAYKEAEDKAKDKASEILKKRMEEENIDLTDFGDKSIAQVRTLLQRLGNLKADIEAEMAKLEEGGLTENEKIRLAALIEALKILGKQAADTGEELDKKIGDSLKKIASQKVFANIGKEISDFGKQIGNIALEDLGQQVTDIANLAGDLAGKIHDLAEELKDVDLENKSFNDLTESVKGGVISIVATAALAFYKQIKNAIVGYIQHQDLLNEKLYEYRDLMLELRREDFTNIFGTDEMALAAENAKILAEAQQKYNATLDEMNEKRIQGFRTNAIGGRSEVKNQSLIDMLERISEGQGWDLYKNDGNVNIDALEMYFDTFSKRLPRKQRKLVEELIENGKAYDDAAAEQAQYLTDLFSGVADSIADNMINAFIESGNAAIDMGEIMSDVAKEIAKDLINTVFIKGVLDKYEDELKNVMNDETKDSKEKALAMSETIKIALSEIEALIPGIQATLEEFLPYFNMGGGDEDKSLGAGIKGITEDTANLLASYLNAIRADVSYARVIWERMDSSMQQIAAALAGFSAPSLMEYQAQIASNTYNTMLSTQTILSRLESVMDYEGCSPSIRVI